MENNGGRAMPARVDVTKCQGCQGCYAICPEGAIEWNAINNVPIIDDDKCVECGLCVIACDDGAAGIAAWNRRAMNNQTTKGDNT